ncbi:hypothetical protein PLESTB_000022700 [Pleodorina starrii]|uniref:Uncharacterized protein n=1 Tax=Pleodorina starrii TaxID=330485 RepID=A0A9W6EWQ2_9CHLO|nr:hypothetical protein PLESTM_001112100 [Pleodorina starrii]GLC47759.1 hypothetical protein PLESTB_000022700 [Pleodorina starrii]GLC70827.1 hypothetical protein PLESTF_001037300 [Pleodorina starrii]
MQRSSKHNMDDFEKGTALLQAPTDAKDLNLQMEEELVEREAAAAISARRAFSCRVVAGGFIILFVVLLGLKTFFESPDEKRSFSASCMHALGGGAVGPRGSLLHFNPRCTEELKEYFDQAYYAEVRRVSDEAMAYFRQLVARQDAAGAIAAGSSRGTVIFDIDETALSNMDGFFGPSSWSRLFGRTSPNRCVRPHLEYANLEPLRLQLIGDTGRLAPVQTARKPLCYAPPLKATLDLYNYLYDNNFTLVFLTGRSEDARAETEANLADAGYGRKCDSADHVLGVAAASHRRQALQSDTAAAVDAAAAAPKGAAATTSTTTAAPSSSSSSLPFVGLFSPPAAPSPRCYAELLMREMGDERLASVFKAEARGRLVSGPGGAAASAAGGGGGGHVLVGSIGDQFSDLVGQAAAVANFKLPNPVYTLL